MIYLYDPPKDGNCLIWCLRIVMSVIRHELVNSFSECHKKLPKNHEFFKHHSSLDQSEIITALEYTDELITYSTEGDSSSLDSLDKEKCYLHLIGNHYYVILSQELGEIIEQHQWDKIPNFLIPLFISVTKDKTEEHSIIDNKKIFSSHRIAYDIIHNDRIAYDIIDNDKIPRKLIPEVIPEVIIKYIWNPNVNSNMSMKYCMQVFVAILHYTEVLYSQSDRINFTDINEDEIYKNTNAILDGNIELKTLDKKKCYIRRRKTKQTKQTGYYSCSVILPDIIGEMLVRKQFSRIPLFLLNVFQCVEADCTEMHTEKVTNSGVNLVMLSASKISYDIKTIETTPPPYA